MWDKLKEQLNILKLEKKKLYLITNSDNFNSKDDFLDTIASAIQGGVDVICLREKNFPDNVIVEIGHKIRTLCDEYGTTFIVNDRPDIALIVEADGVHLGQNDISVTDARNLLGKNAIIGKSTYNTDETINAINQGVDYLTFGPIQINQTKTSLEINDIDSLKWVTQNIDIPVFITGEISHNNINALISMGVKKIAVTKPILEAKSPELSARTFLKYM